jgi:hypothetical protein
MKTIDAILVSFLLVLPCSGRNFHVALREMFALSSGAGTWCAVNPVCVAEGRVEGACCPSENYEFLSCCNIEYSVHANCNELIQYCCPAVDNLNLECCEHLPAISASRHSLAPCVLPSSYLSDTPYAAPSTPPSARTNPSRTLMASPGNSPRQFPSSS